MNVQEVDNKIKFHEEAQQLNTLESRYANVWPKSKRYFLMLQELENSYYVQ